MLATQLKYDLLMFIRELSYLIFIVVIPPATYLFLGKLYGDITYAGDLSYAEVYTPSFILLITFGVIFFAFGFDQVTHRTTGVEKRISLSPVSKRILLMSGVLKSIILTSIGFSIIYFIGLVVYQLPFNTFSLIYSYSFFVLLNIILLVISSAIYALFNKMNSALVFSIVLFQVVMVTGGFAIPIEMMPKFVKVIAFMNPVYHMNELFIAVWNGKIQLEKNTFISIGIVFGSFFIALFASTFQSKKRN